MEYSRLALASGGGITVNAIKAPQENCAVIAIGLGGTGFDCLQHFKKSVYEQIQPDNPDSEIPKYSHFRFLAIDSDDGKIEKDQKVGINKVTTEEFLSIKANTDISSIITPLSLDSRPDIKPWILNGENGDNRKIDTSLIRDGAGGIRQVGRCLLLLKSAEVLNRIKTEITEAKRGLTGDPGVYIYIFAGIGGGTGAGTFLDVCYLVKQAIKETGVNNARTSGFFFLPDVNLSNPTLPAEVREYIQMNGYASMKELDYCMQFENNGDMWRQTYCSGSVTVESKEMPVDMCHLISATDINGNMVNNPYNYAMGVVSSYLMDFMAKKISSGDIMDFNGHIANFVATTAMYQKTRGAKHNYCLLGASTAIIPHREIMTYLASFLFEQFEQRLRGGKESITPADAKNLARDITLTHAYVMGELQKGANTTPVPPLAARDVVSQGSGWCGGWLNEVYDQAAGNFGRNRSDLRTALPDDYKLDIGAGIPTSLIARIFVKLREYAADPAKGPYYADALLKNAASTDLINVIDGLIEESNERIRSEEAQRFLLDKYEQAKREFDTAGALAKKGKAKDLLAAISAYASHWIRLNQLGMVKEVFIDLKDKVVKLQQEYFGVLTEVCGNLVDTFNANRSYLESHKSDIGDSFEFPLMTIADLEESLKKTIKDIDAATQVKRFVEHFINDPDNWRSRDENAIAKTVSDFFGDPTSGIFKDYTNQTINTYLEAKYAGRYMKGNDEELAALLSANEIGTIVSRSSPVFWLTSQGVSDNYPEFSYFTVPSICNAVKLASTSISNVGKMTLRPVEASNKISIIRCRCAAAMYSYNGLPVYENVYNAHKTFNGKHLHEGKVREVGGVRTSDKDWREIGSPVPASLIDINSDTLSAQKVKPILELFEKAVEKGVIERVDNSTFIVKKTSDEKFAEFVALEESALALEDKVSVFDILEKMKAMNIKDDKVLTLFNDAYIGADEQTARENSERVVKDHFCAYPEVQNLVKTELDRIIAVTEGLKKVAEHLDRLKIEGNVIDDFVNALCTGLVKVTGPKMELVFTDSFGYDVSEELSLPRMAFGKIALYQALQTFKDLSQGTKNSCKEVVDNMLNTLSDEDINKIKAACDAIAALFTPDKKRLYTMVAGEYPENKEDILKTIKDIEAKINNFKITYIQ